MKLSKEQIKYIDDYLKHHKFKYWDIRFEILDHIVNTVENKMNHGISFDDAMIEVHKSFGNSMKMFWNTGVEYSIFANSNGYKNLIHNEKLKLNKKYRRLIFTEFLNFFKSIKNLFLLFVFLIFEIKLFETIEHKLFLKFNLLLMLIPILISIYLIIKFYLNKNRSYNLEMSQFTLTIFITSFYLVSLITKTNLPVYVSYSILVGYMIINFIWFFSGLKVHRKTEKIYSKYFKELKSI